MVGRLHQLLEVEIWDLLLEDFDGLLGDSHPLWVVNVQSLACDDPLLLEKLATSDIDAGSEHSHGLVVGPEYIKGRPEAWLWEKNLEVGGGARWVLKATETLDAKSWSEVTLVISSLRGGIDIDVGRVDTRVLGDTTVTLSWGNLGAVELVPRTGVGFEVEVLDNGELGAAGTLNDLPSCEVLSDLVQAVGGVLQEALAILSKLEEEVVGKGWSSKCDD